MLIKIQKIVVVFYTILTIYYIYKQFFFVKKQIKFFFQIYINPNFTFSSNSNSLLLNLLKNDNCSPYIIKLLTKNEIYLNLITIVLFIIIGVFYLINCPSTTFCQDHVEQHRNLVPILTNPHAIYTAIFLNKINLELPEYVFSNKMHIFLDIAGEYVTAGLDLAYASPNIYNRFITDFQNINVNNSADIIQAFRHTTSWDPSAFSFNNLNSGRTALIDNILTSLYKNIEIIVQDIPVTPIPLDFDEIAQLQATSGNEYSLVASRNGWFLIDYLFNFIRDSLLLVVERDPEHGNLNHHAETVGLINVDYKNRMLILQNQLSIKRNHYDMVKRTQEISANFSSGPTGDSSGFN